MRRLHQVEKYLFTQQFDISRLHLGDSSGFVLDGLLDVIETAVGSANISLDLQNIKQSNVRTERKKNSS